MGIHHFSAEQLVSIIYLDFDEKPDRQAIPAEIPGNTPSSRRLAHGTPFKSRWAHDSSYHLSSFMTTDVDREVTELL
jgi:hypothetical protein